jgi:flagellar hook-associated protein 3 FlgL
MGIRITNKIMTNNSLNNVNTNKTLLDKVSTQVSTQQKILRASEDPVVAIRALRLKNSLSSLNQYYSKNIPDAESWLESTQTALTNMKACTSSILSIATKLSSNQYSLSEKKDLLAEYQSLREQIYAEGNADMNGRSLLTGYKTNMDLAFKTADLAASYRITESFSGTDVEAINYVSGCMEVNASDILSSTDTEYDQDTIKNNSLYRLRLAYGDLTENSDTTAQDLIYSSSGKLSTELTVGISGSTTGYVKATVNLNPATGVVSAAVDGTDSLGGSYTASVDTATGIITIEDSIGTNVGTFNYAVDGNTVTASKTVTVNAVSLEDAGGSDAAYLNTSAEEITFIKETGELILGAGVYQSLQNCGENAISFTYEKTGFDEGELKPEHYFNCTNLVTGAEYVNENSAKNIDYVVNFNQTITVNTEAKNVFDQSIGRDVDDLIAALETAIAADTKMEKLKSMLKDTQYNSKTEYIQSMIEACEKEKTYAQNKLQELAEQSITNFKGYVNGFTSSITEVGSKLSRLALTEERALKQQTNLETLSEENIGVELSDVLIEQEAASLAYDAALSATSKVITHSLLNFL